MSENQDDNLIVTEDRQGTRYQHPAFGKIAIGRINSNGMKLHGTTVSCHTAIAVTISRASMTRDLSHDWHFAEEELIEVWLSPVQWAELLTSIDTTGVPCTIKHIKCQGVPEPVVPNKRDQFDAELRAKIQKACERTRQARDLAKEIASRPNVTKAAVKELAGHLAAAVQELVSNAPFLIEQLDEQMDASVAEAKAEVDAFIQHTIARMGLEKLAEMGMGPLALGFQEDAPHRKEDT